MVSGGRDGLYFMRRSTGDAEWYWAVNDSPEARSVTARFGQGVAFEKWDAASGERSPLASDGSGVRLEFGPFDAFYVVRSAGVMAVKPAPAAVRRVLLELPRTGWRFTAGERSSRSLRQRRGRGGAGVARAGTDGESQVVDGRALSR